MPLSICLIKGCLCVSFSFRWILKFNIKVINMVGQLVLDVVDGVLEIQAEQNSSNNATDNLPPTLPHELAKIHRSAFGEILSVYIN